MPVVYLPKKLISDIRKPVIADTYQRFHQVSVQPYIREQIITQSPRIVLSIRCKEMLVAAKCKGLPFGVEVRGCVLKRINVTA